MPALVVAESTTIENAPTPWLFTSAVRGLTHCRLPLLGENDPPARYTVKLYFAELNDGSRLGERVFDVRLQGETVLENLDVLAEADGPHSALVREVKNVRVSDNLTIDLIPQAPSPTPAQMPLLNAVEVVRTGWDEGE